MPHPGQWVTDNIELVTPIAQGAMGKVWVAYHHRLQVQVAVKFVQQGLGDDTAEAMARFEREAAAMERVQHPGVVRIVGNSSHGNLHYLWMDFVEGGSLRRILDQGRLTPARALNFARQIIQGLGAAHDVGVIHRDLKPENVLFTDASHTQVKLCDFGFAVRCGERRLRTGCGSAQYMAPELHTPVGEGYLGMPVDMWALGALLYEMLHGKPAFRGVSMEQLKLRILRVSNEPFASGCSAGARSLVEGKRELRLGRSNFAAGSECRRCS